MNFNYNFEDQSSIQTFGQLKDALKERFDELFSKGYLYKGDMGETPQIVNRPLVEKGEWTALGKSIIGEIFKDTKNEKYKNYYENSKVVDIDRLIAELTEDGKLSILNSATSSASYPWWCADGNSKYPIYPATYFVYVDSTPNNIRNDDNRWKDNPYGKWEDDSCVLIPAHVEYNDYRDDAPGEELEPMITYHKNHIYPTFYFDPNAKGAAAGAWCWKINDVETGIPASVANADGTVLGHMFIFKNEDGVYKYKAGVDAKDKWMTRQEMMNSELRYPINGDIGFTIEKAKEIGDNPTTTETTGDDSVTIASINTLQIYNFVEDDNDSTNGGDWGLGGNLISFGESFYKALWEFISGDSGVEINKGKIILAANSGNHCIFVKNDVNKTGQTLVLMPLDSKIDPTSKEDFNDDETWSEAKLQLNYPETTINGAVVIKSNLDVSDKNIKAGSIDASEDISCRSIKAASDITAKSSIRGNEIAVNNFRANDGEVIIGSDTTRVNIISPNFKVTNNLVDTNLPFTSSNIIKISDAKTPKEYIKIYADKTIDAVRKDLDKEAIETKSTTTTIISGHGTDEGNISSTGSYNGQGKGIQNRDITVTYKSKEYDLPEKIDSVTLSMPSSLGITINVKGKINYGSWPLLKGGSMTLKIVVKTDTGEDKVLCTHTVPIAGNNSSGFSKKEETKWCTIYCSFTSEQLNTASLDLTNFKNNYKSIYITAEATFNLGVDIGTLNKPHDAIYAAGTICYVYPYTRNSSGGSIWTSSIPSGLLYDIFNISTTELISTDSGNTTTVSICRDGILIGRASNKSAVLYIDKAGGFNIDYYRPKADSDERINVLSIDTSGYCYSDVFQLRQSTTASSAES